MSAKKVQALRAQGAGSQPLPEPTDMGFGNQVQAPYVAPSAWEASNKRLAREDAASTADYIGSIWRQDGLADAFTAELGGRELMPDPDFNVFADEAKYKELIDGIQPEFQPYLSHAHSEAHAHYLRGLIHRKQEDLLRLNDMGWKGNVGRLALNVVMPDVLLAGIAGGYVARGVRAAQALQTGRRAASAIEGAERAAAVAASQARFNASPAGVAAGVATGAAENMAIEKLRQNLSFEDDNWQVLEAGLLGAAITTPFALAGARSSRRIATAATKEHDALRALRDLDEGRQLTPEQGRLIKEVSDAHEVVRKVESGELSAREAAAALDTFHGPREPDEMWMRRFGDDIEARGRQVLDELFPHKANERATARALADVGQVGPQQLLLGYEPGARGQSTLVVDPRGNALPGTSPKLTEAELQRIAKERFPKNAEKAERWLMEQRATLLGLTEDAGKLIDEAKAAKAAAQQPLETPPQSTVAEAFMSAEQRAAAPTDAPVIRHSQTANEVPPAPRDRTGEYVSWADPKTGDGLEGRVMGRNSQGRLSVQTRDGTFKIVDDHMLDDAQLGEVPSGFLPGSIGAAQIQAIQSVATQTSRASKLRLDIFATLNRSQSEEVRKLVFALVKDPLQVDAKEAQGFTASEWKAHYKRTVGGMFHRETSQAASEAAQVMKVPFWARSQFNHEFQSLVSRLTRGDQTVLHVHQAMAPMLQKASAAQKAAYDQLLNEAQKAGVKGAKDVQANPFYVNRVWNHRGIRDAILTHGHDAVVDLLARSINVPGYVGDRAKATQFLATVRKLEFAPVMQNIHLYAQDMGTLRNELKNSGKLNDSEIDALVDLMFDVKASTPDGGQAKNLRYRFDINETLGINLKTGVLRLSDLMENDARVLMDTYVNSMGGHIGLAKNGIDSQATFMARLRMASDEALKHPDWDTKKLGEDLKLLEDVYANITGRPMSTQDFSKSARIAAAFRGYTRSVMLGQLGIAAAFEMKQAVGLLGFRALIRQVPSLWGFFRAVRHGYIPDVQLARDVEHIAGFGTEMASSYARAQEIDDGFMGQLLTRAEAGANKVSHAVDILSGNSSFTSLTRQLTSMMAIQHFHDLATGLKKLTPAQRERMVGNGVDDVFIDTVLNDLKTFTSANKGNKVEHIDYDQWSKTEPESYQAFQLMLSRTVRDAIQDHDLGETIPFMHTTLGKMFAELKTFFLVAHAKNFLKNATYMDATAIQVWTIGFIGESLAYMTQSAANNAHDPSKLQEALDPQRIATAAMFRASSFGMLPMLAETTYGVFTGGDSLVQPGFTTNTDSRSMFNTPSLTVAKRILNVPATASGYLLNSDVTTRQEARDLFGAFPGSNLYGVRNLASYLAGTLPVSDYTQRD